MNDQSDPVSITVYSRESCHLCEEAIATLEGIAEEEGINVAVEEVNIDADPDLREEYGDRIPYVLFEGRPAFKFRVDDEECRERLHRLVQR